MGLKVGIVGLPNVGKSTLFNAILGRQAALTAPYPFATVEPNVGVAEVFDERLIKLRDAMFPKLRMDTGNLKLDFEIGKLKIENQTSNFKFQDQTSSFNRQSSNSQPPLVPATVTFVDIAGLVKGASQGQGLGNQFLGHIRDVDLILHVLRDFDPSASSGQAVPRAQDSKNPEHDAEIVKMELELKDLEIAERKSSTGSTGSIGSTGGGLAGKPVIYAVNVGEDKLPQIASYQFSVVGSRSNDNQFSVSRSQTDKPKTDNRIFFCAKIEEEISKMPINEQKEYLKIYGLESSCLDRIIGECFQALGLVSFFTAGPKEVRAWPVRRESLAAKAAGVIHSDFEKLFIRAEVIGCEKLAEAGSWQEAKNHGWVRMEGRDYLIQDGDVCNFLISR